VERVRYNPQVRPGYFLGDDPVGWLQRDTWHHSKQCGSLRYPLEYRLADRLRFSAGVTRQGRIAPSSVVTEQYKWLYKLMMVNIKSTFKICTIMENMHTMLCLFPQHIKVCKMPAISDQDLDDATTDMGRGYAPKYRMTDYNDMQDIRLVHSQTRTHHPNKIATWKNLQFLVTLWSTNSAKGALSKQVDYHDR
jgi:hypothetical protein